MKPPAQVVPGREGGLGIGVSLPLTRGDPLGCRPGLTKMIPSDILNCMEEGMRLSTIEEIERLSAIFRKSPPSPLTAQTIHKVYQRERSEISSQLAAVKADLEEFEQRHQMASDQFLIKYNRGELGDDLDFFEWSSLCKMKKNLEERLRLLDVPSDE